MAKLARGIDGWPVVASDSERDLLYPTPQRDQRVMIRGTGELQRYTGAAWAVISPAMKGSGGVYDIRAYGATCDGVADDTDGFLAACTALQANGGGKLVLPALTRLDMTDALPASPLVDFSDLTNVQVETHGTLTVDRNFALNELVDLFHFTDCTGVTLNVHAVSPVASTTTLTNGPTLAKFYGACRNVEVTATLYGFYAASICNAAAGAADNARTKGVVLDLSLTDCYYGHVSQFSGDQVTGTIVANGIGRSLFLYGIRGAKVRVESKNNTADDVMLRGYEGQGLSDLDISYTNTQSTTAATAAPCVTLAPNVSTILTTPSTFRNIKLNIHVEYSGTGGPGHALHIIKTLDDTVTDTVDRGHIIDGLTLDLTVKGQNQGNTAYPLIFTGTWGTSNDRFTNWRVDRATMEGVTNTAYFNLVSLRDRAVVRDIVASNDWALGAGSNGTMTVVNCKAASLCNASGDTSAIDYVGCVVSDASKTATTNKNYLGFDNAGTYLNAFMGRQTGLTRLPMQVRTVTASGNIATTDGLVMADATGGAITLTLPAASGCTGQAPLYIQKIDGGANTVTIDGNGAELVGTALTKVLSSIGDTARLISYGTGWLVV